MAAAREQTQALKNPEGSPSTLKFPDLYKKWLAFKAEKVGKDETLKRCIHLFNEMMDYAMNSGELEYNPCAKVTEVFNSPQVTNRPASGDDELPELFKVINAAKLSKSASLFALWSICSMLRPKENTCLRWDWFDLKKKLLIIPAKVMKMRREHRVPLTEFMLEILKEQ